MNSELFSPGNNANESLLFSEQRESAVDIVISSFKRLLINKKLLPGDRIPSESELAKRLSVSRGSVREAMKILAAFGIVEIKRGNGTYIAESISTKLFDPLLFSLILNLSDLNQLVELREMIEREVVKLIILKADDEDIRMIREVYLDCEEKITEDIENAEISRKCDLRFHKALGKATKNDILAKIYEFLLELYITPISGTYETNLGGIRTLYYHKKLVDALEEKNLDKANEIVADTIEKWKTLFQRFFEHNL